MLLSKIQGLEAAINQLPELLDGRGAIRKQVASGLFIFGNPDRAVMNSIVDEVKRDAQFFGELGNSEESLNPMWVRLMSLDHNPMFEPNRSDRTGQEILPHR